MNGNPMVGGEVGSEAVHHSNAETLGNRPRIAATRIQGGHETYSKSDAF